MSSSPNESALKNFVEKIDFAKLEGKPEDFYKAGLTFVENGQFDEGILEFVKIIQLASTDSEIYRQAVKELKSMGFSDSDIRGDTSLQDAVQVPLESPSDGEQQIDKKDVSSGTKFLGTFLAIIIVIFLLCTAVSGFDGVMFILAFLGGPLLIIALIVGGLGFYVSGTVGDKKPQPSTNETSDSIAEDGNRNALEKIIDNIERFIEKIEKNINKNRS